MRYARFLFSLAVLVGVELRAEAFDAEQFTAAAKASLLEFYVDPRSAQFRETYVIRWDDKGRQVYTLCGEINAKNLHGGYVGFTPFFVDRLPSGELSPSSALYVTVGKDALARFSVEHCTGRLRPVERVN